ncbi:MAG: type II toxin-antitoxin system RelE/ParE family toxin [Bacteroidetes bacterium]|nr:MAG: type II toxin-antitoxin system RelE/ParE family toxin [Bacteroidota bacterium]
MQYKVSISDRAIANLENIFEYLIQNWSEKVDANFKKILLSKIHSLSENPFMYPESNIKHGIRKCVVTKHNILYYRIITDEIEIITIHDTRQNPKSLELD